MKSWLFYLVGLLTGIVLSFVVMFIIGQKTYKDNEAEEEVTNEQVDNGITMFDEPGDIIEDKACKVIQVIAKNAAIVKGQRKEDANTNWFVGITYVITNHEGKYYYDDEIIKVPKDKVVRQIGIYRYETTSGEIKTVPIIEIMDK